MYPPKLPDLFQGTQLVVIGRYTGNGHSAIRLSGMVGKERTEFVYELNFPAKTASDTGKDTAVIDSAASAARADRDDSAA